MSDPKISSHIETAMENVTNVWYPKIYGLRINNIKYVIDPARIGFKSFISIKLIFKIILT